MCGAVIPSAGRRMASIGILVALHAAPPIALCVGIIDLVSAALTVWALATERERGIAPPK